MNASISKYCSDKRVTAKLWMSDATTTAQVTHVKSKIAEPLVSLLQHLVGVGAVELGEEGREGGWGERQGGEREREGGWGERRGGEQERGRVGGEGETGRGAGERGREIVY